MGWTLYTFKRQRDKSLRNLAKFPDSHFEPSYYPLLSSPDSFGSKSTKLLNSKGRNVIKQIFTYSWRGKPPLLQVTSRPLQNWSKLFIELITHKSAMKRKQAENPKTRKRGEEGLPDSRSPSAPAPRPEWAGQTLGHKTSPEAQSPGEASVAAGVEQDGGALPRVRSAPATKNTGHSHNYCLVLLLYDSWNLAVPKQCHIRIKKEG